MRKFYKTVIQTTVLSEEPFEYENLSQVNSAITAGDCSGKVETVEAKELSGKEMAQALLAQGSDPQFFQIDENGESIE